MRTGNLRYAVVGRKNLICTFIGFIHRQYVGAIQKISRDVILIPPFFGGRRIRKTGGESKNEDCVTQCPHTIQTPRPARGDMARKAAASF